MEMIIQFNKHAEPFNIELSQWEECKVELILR